MTLTILLFSVCISLTAFCLTWHYSRQLGYKGSQPHMGKIQKPCSAPILNKNSSDIYLFCLPRANKEGKLVRARIQTLEYALGITAYVQFNTLQHTTALPALPSVSELDQPASKRIYTLLRYGEIRLIDMYRGEPQSEIFYSLVVVT